MGRGLVAWARGESARRGELERPGVLFETATAAGRRAFPLGAEPGVRYTSELGEGTSAGTRAGALSRERELAYGRR